MIGIFKLVFNIGTRYLVFVYLFGPILYNTISAYWKPERGIRVLSVQRNQIDAFKIIFRNEHQNVIILVLYCCLVSGRKYSYIEIRNYLLGGPPPPHLFSICSPPPPPTLVHMTYGDYMFVWYML